MSMLGNFKQISPSLLERVKQKPVLVKQVVRYRPPGPVPESDAEAFISLLPAHMKKMVDSMPLEERASFLAQIKASMGDMPPILLKQIAAARNPTPRKDKSAVDIQPADVGAELDIGKAWHGVHYLLCGVPTQAPPPLGNAILGGTEIGPDQGFGPTRYLEPAEVKAVAEALGQLTIKTLEKRYDHVELERQKIYPCGWTADPELKQWLCDAYSQVQAFYETAAQGGYAILLYLV